MKLSRRTKISVVVCLIAGAAFVATEHLYYLPLTPLSLDLSGDTRLPAARDRIRLLFVGDTLLGDWAERTLAHRGHDHVFDSTRPLLQEADLAIGNLEGPVTIAAAPDRRRTWSYRMLPQAALALKRAGFDLMTLANNHIRDCGDAGVHEAIALLRAAGVTPFGAGASPGEAHAPAIRDVRGVKVAFLGYVAPRIQMKRGPHSMRHVAAGPRRAGAAWGDPRLIARDIARARRQTDLVIVSIHMGDRYQEQPTPYERRLCHAVIDAGADAVVGHGTHIMGPIEVYHHRPILYSVGNFAFGSVNLFARFSLIAYLEIDLRTRRLSGLHALPIYTMNADPWVEFQPKVLVGYQARRVLGQLLELSRPRAEGLELRSGPLRLYRGGFDVVGRAGRSSRISQAAESK
jgi:poly-gamma-glutamate capsule biosynthesis protein CapA/YwtB (metallophosphatase superfamily)